ncbi:MAG: PDDEXK nuclease domain-containing protein [Bifidobacteriaceae bacterium]|jgi:predicted nuclease of restriction endonuclease-like (RecB) superfamily|nr:PDDEXK nuclease domain-containing protein [Bifidobacteriaceae bacterium]
MTDLTRPDARLSSTQLRETDPASLDLDEAFSPLLAIIEQAQARAYRAVNYELVGMYWDVGEYISARVRTDGWGKGVVKEFSAWIQVRLPGIKGFSPPNVWRMKQLYETYAGKEELSTLLRETTWSNNLAVLTGAKTDEARQFYLSRAIKYRYAFRELERQINSLLYERTVLYNETHKEIIAVHPELASLRDSYTLEFLGLPRQGRERNLREAIVANLRDFILEFGKDFAFVGQEYRLQVGAHDYFIDLLFQNRDLNCLVAVELKAGEFKPEYLGQLNFYLEALDRDVRKLHENPSVGLILCTGKDDTVVEYAMSRSLSPAMVAEYQLHLPAKNVLEAKLRELTNAANLDSLEREEP